MSKNVYEASLERIDYMFENFNNIYVSFSGGKDSGVCTHLVLEKARQLNRKVGLLHIDIEAAYEHTMQYVKDIYKEYSDVIIPIWICLPMTTDNGLSYFEQLWTWWETNQEEKWVRQMPKEKYIINLNNHPFSFYKENMTFENFVMKFAEHYSEIYGDGGKTACVVGIRTQESINRWRAIHKDKNSYNNKKYTTEIIKNKAYNFYPIFDWSVEDIWIYYAKTGKQYNKIYDLMYYAGMSINKMRIDEPFGNESKAGLNLFRILEPNTWNKVVSRVSGANISNIYQKKGFKQALYTLPENHTWKTYTLFLLETLPEETRKHYENKFDIFIKWWITKGSGMEEEQIQLLEDKYANYIENTQEISTRGKKDKTVIKFKDIVDTIPELDTKVDVLTWKRLAMVILKNDYWCTSLSFGLTKNQIEKRNETLKKYQDLL